MFSLLKRLLPTRTGESASAVPEDELNAYIDLAIKQFDSRLSAIPGYRKKLRQPVETALLYLESLIGRIPGPIEINNSAYATDPQVHAFFGSPDQIEHLFSHSRDFRDFAGKSTTLGLSHGYALMIMSRQEKKRPGQSVIGEQAQYDVMQEVVVFSEHHLAAPAESDQDTRGSLLDREFKHLVAEAVAKVARHAEEKTELDRKRVHLKMELKTLQANREPAEPAADPAEGRSETCAGVARQLGEVEAEIANASRRMGTINDYLELLIGTLANPSECCTLELRSDRLNRANQKVVAGEGNEIPYAELTLGNRQYNMVVVKYPLNELVTQSSIADLVDRVYSR